MDKIAIGPAADRRDLFRESASRLGMNPAIVEKGFWVCWILKRLFAAPALKDQMVFKGGTSLSKAYGLIERFSEDIDLILDWPLLGYSRHYYDLYKLTESAIKKSALSNIALLKDVVEFKERFPCRDRTCARCNRL
jgi:predicted nucleotidyltransferase component of viral defense system